jgi:hypothetical protein
MLGFVDYFGLFRFLVITGGETVTLDVVRMAK